MSFIKHTSCNVCNSSDANALYKDGGTFCWSCRHYSRGTVSPYALEKDSDSDKKLSMALPDNCGYDYPEHVLAWVFKYGLSITELISNNVYYSKQRDQLIYTWWGENEARKDPVLWQARNFSKDAKQKCYTRGTPNDVLPIYRSTRTSPTLVLVEDPISAIKVLRHSGASMPCLGSDLPLLKLKRLASVLGPFLGLPEGEEGRVVVWLDGNMYHKAQKMADRLKMLGVNATAVYTELDPKACEDKIIQKMLDT